MIGTPPTVVAEATDTIWSPWPPSTIALTSLAEEPVSHGEEGAEAGACRGCRPAEDALLRKAGDVLGHVAHGVERVRDDDQDGVRRAGDHLLGDGRDDALVRGHEVVAAHAGRARVAGGDDDDVGAGGLLVAVRADHRRLVAEDRAGLVDVERLALREVLDDVDENDVGVVATGDLLRGGRADRARADDGDLPALKPGRRACR